MGALFGGRVWMASPAQFSRSDVAAHRLILVGLSYITMCMILHRGYLSIQEEI